MDSKKTIIAIDDSPQQLQTYKLLLVPRYDVRLLQSPVDTLDFLGKNHADIILLDIEMPEINGFELLQDIRQIPKYMNIPVIIVTGHKESGIADLADRYGALGVLTKPVKQDDLICLIEEVLANSV